MDVIEIRTATAVDKEAVLAINDNVYDGLDYLKAFYDEIFIKCPVATPYVALRHGEIVGFVAAFLVDDGDTVVSRGGRIKPELSRKGCYKKLKQHCLTSSKASTNAFTVFSTNIAIRSSSFEKDNKIILTRPMLRYDFKSLPATDQDQRGREGISQLTQPVLQHFMTSDQHRKYLFPDDRLIVNWVPFKLLPTNIPIIWLMDADSLRLTDVRSEHGTMKGLLSISTTFYTVNGLFLCQMDIYGTDCGSLKRHIEYHLDFMHQRSTGRAAMLMFCDIAIEHAVENIFECNGYKRSIWRSSENPDVVFKGQSLFEKQLSVTTETNTNETGNMIRN